MTTTRAWALVFALAGGVGGCSRTAQTAQSASYDALASWDVPLRVRNHTRTAMKILVVEGGMWKFVGLIDPESAATFYLFGQETEGAPLRIQALPASGGGAARPAPLTVRPGQTVTFTIEPDLDRSVAVVR